MKTAFREREKKLHYASLSHPWTLTHPGWTLAFAGVSQQDLEIELVNIADKDLWVSKSRADDVAPSESHLAQNHKWSDVKNLPKPNKLVFETWNSISGNYMNLSRFVQAGFPKYELHKIQISLPSQTRAAVLCAAQTYISDIEEICGDVQKQKSH